MSHAREYLAYLRERQREAVIELKRYCSIESGSRDKAGVDRVGTVVRRAWQELGFRCETIPIQGSGDHIIARRRSANPNARGRLLCHMHLDTTQPTGTIREHPVLEKDGRVYGPGIHDMKGGWIVLLGAIRALRALDWDELASITVFLCGDEELGSPTARPHIEEECRHADWQIVLEPAREGGNLATSRGVVGAIYLNVQGEFAPSTSGKGASAIVEAAHKVIAVSKLSVPDRKKLLNVGIVEGGTARQAVAAKAWLSIDLRAQTQEDAEDLVRSVRAIADQVVVPGTKTVMSGGITRPAFPRNEGNVRMFRIAQEVGREIGLDLEEAPTQVGGSDGNFGAAMGLATLDGLGAVGGNESGRQFIIADSLSERGALLAGLIERLPELL
jgi:glutamate carboxypeptidase